MDAVSALVSEGQAARALPLAVHAAQLSPADRGALTTLVETLIEAGQTAEAREASSGCASASLQATPKSCFCALT
jgi:thioredoxin-like negative regulator of GroEL